MSPVWDGDSNQYKSMAKIEPLADTALLAAVIAKVNEIITALKQAGIMAD